MGPGARASVRLLEGTQLPRFQAQDGHSLPRGEQALHIKLGEMGVEVVNGALGQGCSCPSNTRPHPRLAHLQLVGLAQRG